MCVCTLYACGPKGSPILQKQQYIHIYIYVYIERVWRYGVYRVYRITEDLWVLQGLGIVGFRSSGLGHEI